MNCTESQDILQQRLDGEPVSDLAALSQHLADCGDCRLLHAAAGQLETGLRKISRPVPPLNLRNNIVTAALKDRAARRRRRLVLGMALAASLLLAVGLAMPVPLLSSNADGFGAPLAQVRNYIVNLIWPQPPLPREWVEIGPPGPSILDQPAVPSLRDSMAEVGTAMVSLTRRTADETVEQTRILTEVLPMPMNVFEAVPPMPEQPIANALQETSQRVATGFEPVTNSARRALSMLLRESPRPVNQ